MKITKISGYTRIIGESQGYIGLPLKDVALNDSVTGPGTPAMRSAWQPTVSEIAALNAGALIVLTVVGTSHPPVMLEVQQDG